MSMIGLPITVTATIMLVIQTHAPLFCRERCKFDPSWYAELTAAVDDATQFKGFSVEVMAAHVSLIYASHMALDIKDPDVWVPSERWCFWFLSEIAGYVKRRVTQVVMTIEQTEVHKRVHNRLPHVERNEAQVHFWIGW